VPSFPRGDIRVSSAGKEIKIARHDPAVVSFETTAGEDLCRFNTHLFHRGLNDGLDCDESLHQRKCILWFCARCERIRPIWFPSASNSSSTMDTTLQIRIRMSLLSQIWRISTSRNRGHRIAQYFPARFNSKFRVRQELSGAIHALGGANGVADCTVAVEVRR